MPHCLPAQSVLTRIQQWRSLGQPEAGLIGVQYLANDEGQTLRPYVVESEHAVETVGAGKVLIAVGTLPTRHRTGSGRIIVFQALEASDGEIMVAAANDRLFMKFAHAIGHPEWEADPRFKTNALRLAHKDELMPQIEAAMRKKSRAENVPPATHRQSKL